MEVVMIQLATCAWLLADKAIAPPLAYTAWQPKGSEGAWAGCGRLV